MGGGFVMSVIRYRHLSAQTIRRGRWGLEEISFVFGFGLDFEPWRGRKDIHETTRLDGTGLTE